jgi:hypothetical protein
VSTKKEKTIADLDREEEFRIAVQHKADAETKKKGVGAIQWAKEMVGRKKL